MRQFACVVGAAVLALSMSAVADDAVLLEAYVDGVVTAHMRQHRTPGVTVSVVKDGGVLFAKGYGYADLETGRTVVGDETLFRIGSVSKTFIWTSVMMLVERGELDLDADVNEYLKGLEIPVAFDAPVTLNDLLAHRAGFEMTLAVFTHADGSEMSVTDALARDMPDRVAPPGLRTSYSNWGSTLASKIVADAAEKPFERFVHDEIFAPLRMAHTTFKGPSHLPPELAEKMSVGFESEDGTHVPADPMQIGPHAPAGAIASTAADMARWMLVHLEGGAHAGVRLMSEDTHAAMWTRAFTDRAAGADLAHGFMTKPSFGYTTYGHGGATSAFYTNMVLVPDLGLGVFVSQNASDDRRLVAELPELVIRRLADGEHGLADTETGDTLAERAEACAGSFMNNRRSFTRFEKLFAAGNATTVEAGDDGSLIVTTSGPPTRHEPLAGTTDTYQDRFGNRIVFDRDDDGRVARFTGPWGVHSYERIGSLDSPNTLLIALGLVGLFTVTTWMGMLWRRGVPQTRTGAGRLVGGIAGLATIAVVALAGAGVAAVAAMDSLDAADLLDYPPTAIAIFRAAALALLVVSVLAALCLWPAWRSSGWRVFRKLHYSLFALALVGLAVMLVRWNVVFAPTAV